MGREAPEKNSDFQGKIPYVLARSAGKNWHFLETISKKITPPELFSTFFKHLRGSAKKITPRKFFDKIFKHLRGSAKKITPGLQKNWLGVKGGGFWFYHTGISYSNIDKNTFNLSWQIDKFICQDNLKVFLLKTEINLSDSNIDKNAFKLS